MVGRKAKDKKDKGRDGERKREGRNKKEPYSPLYRMRRPTPNRNQNARDPTL
jgi:hypothetical protein